VATWGIGEGCGDCITKHSKNTEKSHKWTFLFMLKKVRQENISEAKFDSKALYKNLFIYLFIYYTLLK